MTGCDLHPHLSFSALAGVRRLEVWKTVRVFLGLRGLSSSSVQPVPLWLFDLSLIRLNAALYCCIDGFSAGSLLSLDQAADLPLLLPGLTACMLMLLPSPDGPPLVV